MYVYCSETTSLYSSTWSHFPDQVLYCFLTSKYDTSDTLFVIESLQFVQRTCSVFYLWFRYCSSLPTHVGCGGRKKLAKKEAARNILVEMEKAGVCITVVSRARRKVCEQCVA